MAHAMITAITSGDLATLSHLPNLRESVCQCLYGIFTFANLVATNPLPIQLAVIFCQREVVNFLLDNGADPNQVHPQSNCPAALHVAVLLNQPYLVQLLVSKGAQRELLNENGLTPLHSALLFSDIQTFQTLLTLGAHVAAVNPQGDTVIHAAVRNNKVLQYQILGENPENLALMNVQGLTALQLMNKQTPQMVLVDAGQWNALKNRVAALELAVSKRNARDRGVCPVCGRMFEGNDWINHIRAGCPWGSK
jgi:hypothetical protein